MKRSDDRRPINTSEVRCHLPDLADVSLRSVVLMLCAELDELTEACAWQTELLTLTTLTPPEKLVWLVLYPWLFEEKRNLAAKGACEELASRTALPLAEVEAALQRFADLGLLEIPR